MPELLLDPVAWLVVLVACVAIWGGSTAVPPKLSPIPREVLAFYYGWWGTPDFSGDWQHWAPDSPTPAIAATPVAGRYDSHDPVVLDRHLRQAREAGLTGLIVSWWGRGSFDDHSLDLVLARAAGHGIKVSAYYETVSEPLPGQRRIDAALADISYLLDRHGAHSQWLKVADRPVVFIFGRAVQQIGVEGWWVVKQQLARRSTAPLLIAAVDMDGPAGASVASFDGVHAYNSADRTARKSAPEIAAWAGAAFPRWVRRWRGRIVCLTVMPGFGNAKADDPALHQLTERHGGATYDVLADAAIRAAPDWLLVTSWNEWHEGTEIEASVEHGDRALVQTRDLCRRFLQGQG